jgi:hypothetical protein
MDGYHHIDVPRRSDSHRSRVCKRDLQRRGADIHGILRQIHEHNAERWILDA